MSKFDFSIKELIDIKNEISSFLMSEFSDLKEMERNKLNFIMKKIVFLKYVVRQTDSDYRFHALISDIMYLVKSIRNGEERYYYFNVRSIIEQSLRIINNIDSTNTITNAEIIDITKNMIQEYDATINLNIIKSEYTKSCLYVHGNENASMSLAAFYQQCEEDTGIINEVSVKLNVLVKMLKELLDLILISQNTIIDAAFFGRKTILKYLLGEHSYSVFLKYKED